MFFLPADRRLLQNLRSDIRTLTQTIKEQQVHLNELIEEVAKNRDVTLSAVQAIDGLLVKLEEHINEPAKIAEIVAELRAQRQPLAEAIARIPSDTPTDPVDPPTDPTA